VAKLFSLCLTVKHIEKDNLILYRLADEIDDKLMEFKPFEHYDLENPTARRPNNPYTNPSNYQMNELRIWEWDQDTSGWAKKTSMPFYELSTLTDLMLSDENDIIAKLKLGFKVWEYQHQNLLVKIRETKERYEVLALDSSKIRVVNGIGKINENIHILKGYSLKKEDFLSTEKVTAFSAEGERLPIRHIFKFVELPHSDFVIDISTFTEKLALWINKQLRLKGLGLSRKEIKASKEIFEESLNRADEIKEFFEQNEFNSGNLNERIKQVKAQLEEVLSEGNQYDIFCERMIETLPKLTETFKSKVEENWHKEHTTECETARQEIMLLTKQKEEIQNEYKNLKENFGLLQDEARIIQNRIEGMTTIQENLQTSLETRIGDIRSNISNFFAEALLYKSLLGTDKNIVSLPIDNEATKIPISNQIIQLLSEKLVGEPEILTSTNDMVFFLEMNLKRAGIIEDIVSNLSQYITACMTQKVPLLLVGYGSRNVADAISATLCGMTSDVITLTGRYNDCKMLSKTILSCQSNVVLIENAIGYIDEQIYMQIIKELSAKTLLFSLDFTDQLNFISKSVLNYVNLLCLDDICGRKEQGEYNLTTLNKDILSVPTDLKGLRASKDAVHAASRVMGMSKIYNSFRAELMTMMDSYYKSSAMFSWFIFEVVPFMAGIGRNQEASDLIDAKEFTEQQKNLLRSIVKSEGI
jgi:hypothetical protein